MSSAGRVSSRNPGPRFDATVLAWVVAGAAIVICFSLREEFPWLLKYPSAWTLPIAMWINVCMDWFVDHFRGLFHAISWLLDWPMSGIQGLLHWLPWPATIAVFTVLAHAARGRGLAVFTCLSMLYMVVVGYWDETMNTLSLVFVCVPMAVGLGLLLGIFAYKSWRINRIIQPTLDFMQTVPTFAYLIPILLLFGFGPVVGLISSAIYACPPMVRNVILGLQRVPTEIVESGAMSGATRRQLLWWVEVPSALPTIMIGVNQTIMAALSMVIIAAIIGSSADIGWEVLSTMRKAQFGQSLLSGAVIALIAMVMDRISRGFAEGTEQWGDAGPQADRRRRHAVIVVVRMLAGFGLARRRRRYAVIAVVAVLAALGLARRRRRYAVVALAAVLVAIAASRVFPSLSAYPQEWVVYPAAPINEALDYTITEYPGVTKAIRDSAYNFLLLPLRIGVATVLKFKHVAFGTGMQLAYLAVFLALAVLAARMWSWRAAVAVLLFGGIIFYGLTTTPWPVFVLTVTLLGWQVGGWRIALFAFAGLAFMLAAGVWKQAMLSVYLCGAAVLTSFVAGGMLGVWAANSDRVSGFLRPINDTLQTMPLFVILIPVLMFFHVGEFTAFLAIIAYAIVPSMRYTEHGLRNIRPDVVEAARAMGCTRSQMLWQVKLPLAIPEIMLGLNQTIMFGLAMLVIAALVGTKGLGQSVYIALGKANTGLGLVAGLGMALIAMIADRIIQAWSARRKAALGLA